CGEIALSSVKTVQDAVYFSVQRFYNFAGWTASRPTGWAGDRNDQSDPSGMGELLCGGALESVLLVYQRLGGEKGPAASDAGSEAAWFRLAAMESEMAVQWTRSV